MPYAHKYANAVTENGMLGAVRRFLPDEGLFNAAMRGGRSLAKKDIEGMTTLLIDAEMKMFEGLRTPVIFLQNVVVDLLLGLGFNDAFTIFADHVRERYDAEPGFITMNLPALLDVLDELGIDNPIVCANINKIGFRMCGGIEAYEAALRSAAFRAVAMSVFASGAIPRRGGDRVGLRAAERRVDRLRRLEPGEHPQHPGAGRRALGPDDAPCSSPRPAGTLRSSTTCTVALAGSRVPSAGSPSTPPRAARCWPTRRSTSFPSSAVATPPMSPATSARAAHHPHAAVDAVVSTGSAVALPFFALGRARGLHLPLHRERRADRGPVAHRPPDRPRSPASTSTASTGLGGPGWQLPRLGLRLLRLGAEPRARRRRARRRSWSPSAPTADFGFSRLVGGCSSFCRPRPRCSGRPATPTSAGSGSRPLGDPGSELTAAMAEADVVVAHAGRGAALAALRGRQVPGAGAAPVRANEHIDDHQTQIAAELSRPRPGRDRRSGPADARSPHHRRCDQGRRAGRGSAVPARRKHPCPSPILGTDAVAAGTPRSPHLACFVATPRWHGFGQRSER